VISYQVVLASGDIITATSSAHSDLFKALKGGSNNFGIVTSYTLRTFSLGGIWGGNIIYQANSTVNQQIRAFYDFTKNPHYDINAAVQMSISFSPSFGIVFVDQPFYALPVINPPVLHPFTSIQPQLADTTSLNTLAPFAIDAAASSPNGSRYSSQVQKKHQKKQSSSANGLEQADDLVSVNRE
jgi:hypothetical protein